MNADEFSKHLIAIIIGVDEVPKSDLPKLLSPEKDAQRIAEALMFKQGCDVPNIGKFLKSIPADQFITNQNLFDVRSQYTLSNIGHIATLLEH